MKPEKEAGYESKTQESRCSQVPWRDSTLKAAPGDAGLRFGGSKRGLGVETLEDIAM